MLWLPAVCRKMDIPYCIVKSKSRLGALVHQKTATAICLTAVRPEVRVPLGPRPPRPPFLYHWHSSTPFASLLRSGLPPDSVHTPR